MDDYYYDEDEEVVDQPTYTTTTTTTTPISSPTDAPTTPINDSQANGSITDESDDTNTECSNPGEHKCVNSGTSSQWKTCNFGQWLVRDCAAGLVCYDDGKE